MSRNKRAEAELMRTIASAVLPVMTATIMQLRKDGFGELADELTAQKEDWARTVMHAAGQHEKGQVFRSAARAKREPRRTQPVVRPMLRLVER